MTASINLRPQDSSFCNLTEDVAADESENTSLSRQFGSFHRKRGLMIMSNTRRGQVYRWISICSCILSVFCFSFIFLVFVTSSIFREEPYGVDLKTRLDELSKDVTENNELINTANARLNSDCLNYQGLLNISTTVNVTQLECGGLIRVPPEGQSVMLAYKPTEMYNNNENCLWILDTAVENMRSNVKLQVTVMCEGFSDAEDALSIVEWDRWFGDHLNSHSLRRKGDTFTSDEHLNYLCLSFSTNEAVNGNGFIIRLVTKSVQHGKMGSNWAFTTSPGNFAYGPNKQDDHIAVVINPNFSSLSNKKTVWELKVTLDSRVYFDGSCNDFDSLYVLSVGLGGKTTTLASLCGKSEAVLKTEYPIWVGYISESAVGTGLTLSWSDYTQK